MSEQGAAPDEEGAAVWWASLAGPIVAAGAAREARRSTSEVTRANARNAVNHAVSYALGAVLAVATVLGVASWLEVALPTLEPARPVSWPVLIVLVGMATGSIANSVRGIRAARRGEVFRTPGTVPFVR